MKFLLSILLSVVLLAGEVDRATAFAPTITTRAVTRPALHHPAADATTRLHVAIAPNNPVGTTTTNSAVTSSATEKKSTDENAIPFIIEEIPQNAGTQVYSEICRMCIAAFFNDGATVGRKTPFYKEAQLIYLRNLQQADLKRRRKLHPASNVMFVARRVVPATTATIRQTPLILDLTKNVYNLNDNEGLDYCRGEIIGFVEVTLRPYGLGEQALSSLDDENRRTMLQKGLFANRERPILTNLSVKYEARKSGVGGRLLERCERSVQSRWNKQEIILEVEDDNDNALAFYSKRGYKVLFEDPASRRYDTNGLLLRQLRCRRKVLRKNLAFNIMSDLPETAAGPSFVSLAWQRIKESVNL